MEIGSFIELQFPQGREFYNQTENIARLNSGRAAIWHACRVLGCSVLWLPYYQCDEVRDFLVERGVVLKFYHIDCHFDPVDLFPEQDEAVLLVNYFGIMSSARMAALAGAFSHVIIDHAQAFFAPPLPCAMNVYSCRKFVGVPDGAYVIGENAEAFTEQYEQGFSSDTSLFLLQRIEYGCEGKAYTARSVNEARLGEEGVRLMSKLTRTILDGTDYEPIKVKRRANFELVHEWLRPINRIDPLKYYDEGCFPMVYPLVVEDDGLLARLQAAKHFQGHWWSYLCEEMGEKTFEYWMSRYVIPITIDQRVGVREINYLVDIIFQ